MDGFFLFAIVVVVIRRHLSSSSLHHQTRPFLCFSVHSIRSDEEPIDFARRCQQMTAAHLGIVGTDLTKKDALELRRRLQAT